MNRFKVVFQCILIVLPLILSIILPTDLLWDFLATIADRDLSNLKKSLSEFLSFDKFISLLLGIVISIIMLIILRCINKKRIFNRGSDYFDYHINYYFLASKLLGYGKMTLVKVPLYLQFEVLFKEMFDCIISANHPVKNDKPKVITCNMDYKSNEVNLILSDTYQIESNNLPREKVNLPTVFIERTVGFSGNRTYSPNFLKVIREETNRYRLRYKTVNVFATTNTQHTKDIVSQSFNNGGRTGFKEIYVYEQNSVDYSYSKAHRI